MRTGVLSKDTMNGQQFLQQLAKFPSDTFEHYSSPVADLLRLGETMGAEDLGRLCDAAFLACLCNISFNGLGGCNGEIKPERERNRIKAQTEITNPTAFMPCIGANWWVNTPLVGVMGPIIKVGIRVPN